MWKEINFMWKMSSESWKNTTKEYFNNYIELNIGELVVKY